MATTQIKAKQTQQHSGIMKLKPKDITIENAPSELMSRANKAFDPMLATLSELHITVSSETCQDTKRQAVKDFKSQQAKFRSTLNAVRVSHRRSLEDAQATEDKAIAKANLIVARLTIQLLNQQKPPSIKPTSGTEQVKPNQEPSTKEKTIPENIVQGPGIPMKTESVRVSDDDNANNVLNGKCVKDITIENAPVELINKAKLGFQIAMSTLQSFRDAINTADSPLSKKTAREAFKAKRKEVQGRLNEAKVSARQTFKLAPKRTDEKQKAKADFVVARLTQQMFNQQGKPVAKTDATNASTRQQKCTKAPKLKKIRTKGRNRQCAPESSLPDTAKANKQPMTTTTPKDADIAHDTPNQVNVNKTSPENSKKNPRAAILEAAMAKVSEIQRKLETDRMAVVSADTDEDKAKAQGLYIQQRNDALALANQQRKSARKALDLSTEAAAKRKAKHELILARMIADLLRKSIQQNNVDEKKESDCVVTPGKRERIKKRQARKRHVDPAVNPTRVKKACSQVPSVPTGLGSLTEQRAQDTNTDSTTDSNHSIELQKVRSITVENCPPALLGRATARHSDLAEQLEPLQDAVRSAKSNDEKAAARKTLHQQRKATMRALHQERHQARKAFDEAVSNPINSDLAEAKNRLIMARLAIHFMKR